MKIIISPAKKMNIDTESGISPTAPVFVKKAEALHGILSKMSYDELKSLWMCSDSIAAPCAETLKKGFRPSPLTPAIFSYDGIQYKYMAPAVFFRQGAGIYRGTSCHTFRILRRSKGI